MVYEQICEKRIAGRKQLAILIDPDKAVLSELPQLIRIGAEAGIDYFFIGGSLITSDNMTQCMAEIRRHCSIPLVLFPGSTLQVQPGADAILFLSLISGRNAEMLIGKHVVAAPYVKAAGLEVIPTGYLLVDGGKPTAVQYMTHSLPIPSDKPGIAVCTAMAGEMLGLRAIYLEAGSGALQTVPSDMVAAVRSSVQVPLIVGGGIHDAETARCLWAAGADMLVVGTAAEQDSSLIRSIAAARD